MKILATAEKKKNKIPQTATSCLCYTTKRKQNFSIVFHPYMRKNKIVCSPFKNKKKNSETMRKICV